jgi:3-phosphoshikimate 1-carboxyvinyltransferase
MICITPRQLNGCKVAVPGSKSYTHRVIIAAALADGISTVSNALISEDTRLTMQAFTSMGIDIDDTGEDIFIKGRGGRLLLPETEIYLGNSGTSVRLITAVAALGTGRCLINGTDRMKERPIGDLVESLRPLGVDIRYAGHSGFPPLEIRGDRFRGGKTVVNCTTSSQFLSALLLAAPLTPEGVTATVEGGPVSRPYVDMTLAILERFGIHALREEYHRFEIRGGQQYRAGMYQVEPDASQASYFWGAAAVTGAPILVEGVRTSSLQGDVKFIHVLERMGCRISEEESGIRVTGGPLQGIEVDMGDMPDLVPTLAVVAAFAEGTTVMTNVAHLRAKESDRLAAVATELGRMGIRAECSADGIAVTGGEARGAVIETYDDHRIAMSFALAGLRVPGVQIRNEGCVAKSFPNFWEVFESMR